MCNKKYQSIFGEIEKIFGIQYDIDNILKNIPNKHEQDLIRNIKVSNDKVEDLNAQILSLQKEVAYRERMLKAAHKSFMESQEFYSGNYIILNDTINKQKEDNQQLQNTIKTTIHQSKIKL